MRSALLMQGSRWARTRFALLALAIAALLAFPEAMVIKAGAAPAPGPGRAARKAGKAPVNLVPNVPPKSPSGPLALRTVIVSGGPSLDYNQYAIESNARYVESLTVGGRSQTVLFADGSRNHRTISTLVKPPGYKERSVFGWLFDDDAPADRVVPRASGLNRLDGPSEPKTILAAVRDLASKIQPGEPGLLYFTGHGALENSMHLVGFHLKEVPDPDKATYATWGNGDLGVKSLAAALEKWPERVPLTVVMVQCHSGGFGNLIFANADPGLPVLDRDICGFFSSIAEREAAGCTDEVDEINYQDFTTHFFAALSGQTRDGRRLPPHSADYDGNGKVSGLEAFAWAQLHDNSIDVPVTTSDIYLRQVFSREGDDSKRTWSGTSYAHLLKLAAPWQRAQLNGLSGILGLSGENRLRSAVQQWNKADDSTQDDQASSQDNSVDSDAGLSKVDAALYWSVQARVAKKFPALAKPASSPAFQKAKPGAVRMLRSMPAALNRLYKAQNAQWESASDAANHTAQIMRFVRSCRTLYLEERLAGSGTALQKSIFARLRVAEMRNPLTPDVKPIAASAVN